LSLYTCKQLRSLLIWASNLKSRRNLLLLLNQPKSCFLMVGLELFHREVTQPSLTQKQLRVRKLS